MRLALAQINTAQGDLSRNLAEHRGMLERAEREAVDVVIFPELSLCGYCPRDLLLRSAFQEGVVQMENLLLDAIPDGMTVIFGSIGLRGEGFGPDLLNEAVVAKKGRVVGRYAKRLMPTYDVFDEARYFARGGPTVPIEVGGVVMGITVCEDIWGAELTERVKDRYACDPPMDLSSADAQLLINISASPYHQGKPDLREEVARRVAERTGLPVLLCNLVGGNDEILFDGSSFVMDASGRTLARAASFEKDLLLVDLDTSDLSFSGVATVPLTPPVEEVRRALVMGLKDYASKSGFKQGLVGLSGGIDSALTAVIAVEALGSANVMGVAMPSQYSADMSEDDARGLAANLGIEFLTLPIEDVRSSFIRTLSATFEGLESDVTEENLQARIRGTLLMALSNKFNRLLLTTGNKSEVAVGYCTLYGDMCGGLAVLSDVPKMLVFELSREINRECEVIPWRTIERPPSAELREGQADIDSLPEYKVLDDILFQAIEERRSPQQIIASGHPETVVTDVLRRLWRNEYKRKQMPPGLRVTSKAFGVGRRMPITGNTTVLVEPPDPELSGDGSD